MQRLISSTGLALNSLIEMGQSTATGLLSAVTTKTESSAAPAPDSQKKEQIIDWILYRLLWVRTFSQSELMALKWAPTSADNRLIIDDDAGLHSLITRGNSAQDIFSVLESAKKQLQFSAEILENRKLCNEVYEAISSRNIAEFKTLLHYHELSRTNGSQLCDHADKNAELKALIFSELLHACFIFQDTQTLIALTQLSFQYNENSQHLRMFLLSMYDESIARGMHLVFNCLLECSKEPNLEIVASRHAKIKAPLLAQVLLIIEECACKLTIGFSFGDRDSALYSTMMSEFNMLLSGADKIIACLLEHNVDLDRTFYASNKKLAMICQFIIFHPAHKLADN